MSPIYVSWSKAAHVCFSHVDACGSLIAPTDSVQLQRTARHRQNYALRQERAFCFKDLLRRIVLCWLCVRVEGLCPVSKLCVVFRVRCVFEFEWLLASLSFCSKLDGQTCAHVRQVVPASEQEGPRSNETHVDVVVPHRRGTATCEARQLAQDRELIHRCHEPGMMAQGRTKDTIRRCGQAVVTFHHEDV